MVNKITKEIRKKLFTWSYHVSCNDNFTCQVCGLDQEETRLNSHHLNHPKSKYPNDVYVVESGITMCETCHRAYHENFMNGCAVPGTVSDFLRFKELYTFLLLIVGRRLQCNTEII